MIYIGIISNNGIECLLEATNNRRFFIVNLTEEQHQQILDLMRNNRVVEATKILEGMNK
jgi:Spy/CpxP family protein refolding chaperone